MILHYCPICEKMVSGNFLDNYYFICVNGHKHYHIEHIYEKEQ